MNPANLSLASSLVNETYLKQASDARKQQEKLVTILLSQRRMPEIGWDDHTITSFLNELASMDSNNFVENVGAGEREGRIYSSLVRERNFGFAHGVGRSGELSAVQPKAAGSSLMYKLTNLMALDAIHIAGITEARDCFVAPLATGMALTLCLSAWSAARPSARYVIWPRIDQKTCFKCILAAGLTPIIVEMALGENGEQLQTDLAAVEAKIAEYGAQNILAILSTSSCFAPRAPDDIIELSKLCYKYDLYHLVNNAYGLQSSKACHTINTSISKVSKDSRLDAFVQSTDKNFMVPVGGSIIASGSTDNLTDISQTYPGRATSSPIIDLFITLLSMGRRGYSELLQNRSTVFSYLHQQLEALAKKYNEKVVCTPKNQISIAMTLNNFKRPIDPIDQQKQADTSEKTTLELSNDSPVEKRAWEPTFVGAMLFNSCTSGIRVVAHGKKQTINGHSFIGYGSHHDSYPHVYLTLAAAIGMTVQEVDLSISRLSKVLSKAYKKMKISG